MEIWAIYAILASFLWAFVNISDQYLVAKYSAGEKGSGGLVLFSSLIGIFIALGIGLFANNIFEISLLDKSLLILSGGFTIAWVILYLYTLEIEDVSAVVPWFLTVPIFGYVFGSLFLGETLTVMQQAGSIITFFGLLLLNINFSDNKNKNFKLKPVLYMLCACLVIATQGILFKYIAVGESFWIASFWQYLGLGIFGVVLFIFVPKYRREFNKMNKDGGKEIFALNVGSELTSVLGNLLSSFATLLAPITLVYLVGSFQPVFVLLLTILGTFFFPKIVKEDISLRVLLPKVIAIIIMTIGSIILFS
ncbi:MAG: DMT family transporter [bacterium]|nr:DMT family transporter [bacterium]